MDLDNIYYMRSIFDADRVLLSLGKGAIQHVVIAGGGYIGLEMPSP